MKVVILWLINERGEILLSQRAVHISSDAGMWGPSVSGKIDAGETPEQAALRETQEELGLGQPHITDIYHLHNSTHAHPDGRLREFTLFYTKVPADLIHNVQLEPNEVAAVKWIALETLQKTHSQAPEVILAGADKPLWDDIFDNLHRAVAPGLQP